MPSVTAPRPRLRRSAREASHGEPAFLPKLPAALEKLAGPGGAPFYTARGVGELLGMTRRHAMSLVAGIDDARKEAAGWIVPRGALAQHLAEVLRAHGGEGHPALRLLARLKDPADLRPAPDEGIAVPASSRYEVRPGEIVVRCRTMREFSAVALQLVRETRSDRARQTEIERGLRKR